MVAHTFNMSTWEADLSELEVRIVKIITEKLRKPVSKKKGRGGHMGDTG